MTENTSSKGDQKKKVGKSIIATVSEALMMLSLLIICGIFVADHDLSKFLHLLIIPGLFFVLAIIYRLAIVGAYVASAIIFLDGIGINGLPAMSLILLLVIGILNFVNPDKSYIEALKIVGGFASGTLAQAKKTKVDSKKQKKDT